MSFYKVPQAGWLQPQKLIVPPSWRLEVKLSESAGLVPSEAVTDSLFLAFPCFCWFFWKSAAVLDLQTHHSNLCLHLHMAFSRSGCVCV